VCIFAPFCAQAGRIAFVSGIRREDSGWHHRGNIIPDAPGERWCVLHDRLLAVMVAIDSRAWCVIMQTDAANVQGCWFGLGNYASIHAYRVQRNTCGCRRRCFLFLEYLLTTQCGTAFTLLQHVSPLFSDCYSNALVSFTN
jgi:hypothetical protein